MDEKAFRKKVRAALQGLGAFCYVTYNPMQQGIPDLHAIYEGHPLWLELKWTEDPPVLPHPASAIQVKFLCDISEAGATAGLLTGSPDGSWFTPIDQCDIQRINRLPPTSRSGSLDQVLSCLCDGSRKDGAT